MVLGRLRNSMQAADLGQHFSEQSRAIEQLKGPPSVAFRQHPRQLVADAFAADLVDCVCELADRPLCLAVNFEIETRSKSNSAEHPKLVLFKAAMRLADGAHDAEAQIVLASDIIENRRGQVARLPVEHRVEQHAVDGEVAADHVFASTRGKTHLAGVAAVEIRYVRPKCSHFGDNFQAPALEIGVFANQNHAKVGADGKGAWKQGQHVLRMRAGGNIEILRSDPEQQIADASTGEVSLMACRPQRHHDALCRDLCRCFDHFEFQSVLHSWR